MGASINAFMKYYDYSPAELAAQTQSHKEELATSIPKNRRRQIQRELRILSLLSSGNTSSKHWKKAYGPLREAIMTKLDPDYSAPLDRLGIYTR